MNSNTKEGESAGIPIIAMTANAFEEDRRAVFAAGMNEHVAKPIEISRLMEVIGMVLKKTDVKLLDLCYDIFMNRKGVTANGKLPESGNRFI